jgi:hypothetical protein
LAHDGGMSEHVCHVCKLPYDVGTKRCANCGASLERAGGQPLTTQDFGTLVPKTSKSTPLILMGALVAVGAIGALVLAGRPQQAAPIAEVAEQEAVVANEPAEAVEVPVPAIPEPPVEPSALPSAQEPEATPSSESVKLVFLARAVSVKGRGVTKGAKCQVNVHVAGADIEDVDVSCGDKVLYDSRTPLNGMASMGSNLFERVKGASWVYRAVYEDLGMRTSRSQLRLNTTNQKATVFSEAADAFSVDLRVDEFSQPREGSPLLGTEPGGATLQAELLFAAERGTPPKIVRDKCSFESKFVETAQDGRMCKSQLRCGGTILYGKGTTGFGSCVIQDGVVVRFLDEGETHEDGDPALVFASQTVTLHDSPGQAEYGLEFSVPPVALPE